MKSYMYMIDSKPFENFNISEDEGIILTNYFEALALIGIEYLNNKKINKFNYDEKLFYME